MLWSVLLPLLHNKIMNGLVIDTTKSEYCLSLPQHLSCVPCTASCWRLKTYQNIKTRFRNIIHDPFSSYCTCSTHNLRRLWLLISTLHSLYRLFAYEANDLNCKPAWPFCGIKAGQDCLVWTKLNDHIHSMMAEFMLRWPSPRPNGNMNAQMVAFTPRWQCLHPDGHMDTQIAISTLRWLKNGKVGTTWLVERYGAPQSALHWPPTHHNQPPVSVML